MEQVTVFRWTTKAKGDGRVLNPKSRTGRGGRGGGGVEGLGGKRNGGQREQEGSGKALAGKGPWTQSLTMSASCIGQQTLCIMHLA